jgi:tetraacyldisaccharide 4'-kinase
MKTLQRWLEARWYARHPPRLLEPLAAVFAAVAALRRGAYRLGLLPAAHPGVPVIVIGNISAGGTGKTPLVLWLVQQLQAEGLRAGIVSRGHGARPAPRQPRLVRPGDAAADVGDEALMLARQAECPVCIGTRRLAAARMLVDLGCQVIVADDGLQHLALRRDMEIAVIDGQRLFGNGALLPAGPLRERPRRLATVDAVVVNGAIAGDAAALPAGETLHHMVLQPLQFLRLDDAERAALAPWRGRAVHAVAGIGNPARFFATLRGLGLLPVEHAFPDHHAFRPADLAFDDDLPIVMTEKDAVKCSAFGTDRMWCLRVTIQFQRDDAARLLQRVRARIAGT